MRRKGLALLSENRSLLLFPKTHSPFFISECTVPVKATLTSVRHQSAQALKESSSEFPSQKPSRLGFPVRASSNLRIPLFDQIPQISPASDLVDLSWSLLCVNPWHRRKYEDNWDALADQIVSSREDLTVSERNKILKIFAEDFRWHPRMASHFSAMAVQETAASSSSSQRGDGRDGLASLLAVLHYYRMCRKLPSEPLLSTLQSQLDLVLSQLSLSDLSEVGVVLRGGSVCDEQSKEVVRKVRSMRREWWAEVKARVPKAKAEEWTSLCGFVSGLGLDRGVLWKDDEGEVQRVAEEAAHICSQIIPSVEKGVDGALDVSQEERNRALLSLGMALSGVSEVQRRLGDSGDLTKLVETGGKIFCEGLERDFLMPPLPPPPVDSEDSEERRKILQRVRRHPHTDRRFWTFQPRRMETGDVPDFIWVRDRPSIVFVPVGLARLGLPCRMRERRLDSVPWTLVEASLEKLEEKKKVEVEDLREIRDGFLRATGRTPPFFRLHVRIDKLQMERWKSRKIPEFEGPHIV
uniref:Uncharacterized protein n=1 Tax=Chromera velia CCMP2878 TaxID=1169474 RepID=A0A0G4GZI3_9ALVE|eukprot:Cvel_24023.t1-p1 / transcript=Cvel_24023.t1 / gene=Cvel_24023 / organism=Chromera_velia_CCMP2878 / gene_product=hypothetical protein / transcript_product=hypothetical protein / location=Cvel_scaffold2549:17869-21314(-) / protein_length=522 / sequence_SO=supercontig / SO=protein_coding / is_pseudo=false